MLTFSDNKLEPYYDIRKFSLNIIILKKKYFNFKNILFHNILSFEISKYPFYQLMSYQRC